MNHWLAALSVAVVGCSSNSSPSMIHVAVAHDAVPDAVFVSAFYGTGTASTTLVLTPQLLAGAASSASTAMRWTGHTIVETARDAFGFGVGVGASAGVDDPVYVGVAAFGATGALVAGGWSGPIDDAEAVITLDPALQPELWGARDGGGTCFRLDTGSTMVFLTRGDDKDCDGLADANDPQPYEFCDPTATSGPPQQECQGVAAAQH